MRMVTYGEFINRATDLIDKFGYVAILLDEWKDLATEEQWKTYREIPLREEHIIAFAEDMRYSIIGRLHGICGPSLYTHTYNDGHAFLRALDELKKELGLESKLDHSDLPITPTDMLIQSGHVALGDKGEILLR